MSTRLSTHGTDPEGLRLTLDWENRFWVIRTDCCCTLGGRWRASIEVVSVGTAATSDVEGLRDDGNHVNIKINTLTWKTAESINGEEWPIITPSDCVAPLKGTRDVPDKCIGESLTVDAARDTSITSEDHRMCEGNRHSSAISTLLPKPTLPHLYLIHNFSYSRKTVKWINHR